VPPASGPVALRAPDPTIDPDLIDACGTRPRLLCEQVFDASGGNETLARIVEWAIDRPLKILLILVLAWIATRLARRALDRTVRRIVAPDRGAVRRRFARVGLDAPAALAVADDDEEQRLADRKISRAASISGVLGSTTNIVIWTIAVIMILGELGLDLGPIIAGAGIAGIALGFGAQSLVKDCISGIFMLIEDQYGIGDIVDLGEAVGAVEEVALRTTVLRGLDGTVWHVPNGEIRRVGNKSQDWSTAVVDVDVAYDADLAMVRDLMLSTAIDMCAGDSWHGQVLDEPVVLGVEALGADGITVRMTIQVAPGSQWALQRQLREALKVAFDDAEIEIPFPQRTLWLRNDER